jgi:hypothetical protein
VSPVDFLGKTLHCLCAGEELCALGFSFSFLSLSIAEVICVLATPPRAKLAIIGFQKITQGMAT